jgi:hypothetical protein
LGTSAAKRADRGAPVGRDAFEHLADREEEDDQRRFLGRADEERAGGGDRHQHLDGEGHAGAGRSESALRHGGDADNAGQDEGPMADARPDQPGGIGSTEEQARRDDETTLARLVPAHAIGRGLMDMAGKAVAVILCGGCRFGCLRAVVMTGVVVAGMVVFVIVAMRVV